MDEDNRKIMVQLWIILAMIPVSYEQNFCNSKLQCPSHKRYCTEVGCVYECPKNFYVNGSTCVLSCGDWFTTVDKICQQSCPDHFYVRENVKQIGQDMYLEKECVLSCTQSEYIFNGTCLRACPADFQYSYNSNCVANCPDGFLFRENSSLILHEEYQHKTCIETCDRSEFSYDGVCIRDCPNGLRYINRNVCATHCSRGYSFLLNFTHYGVLYHNCQQNCPIYEEYGFCVDKCSIGLYNFESSCLTLCPDSHLLDQWGTCVNKCDSNLVVVNGTCKHTCSSTLPYIYNGNCLKECPNEAPLIDSLKDGTKFCVENCSSQPYKYLTNMSCLNDCPESTFKYEIEAGSKTCVSECPNDSPFVCDPICYQSYYGKVSSSGICLTSCPLSSPLVHYNVCVTECPSVRLNKTCLLNCPKEFPFTVNKMECLLTRYEYCRDFVWYDECLTTCENHHYVIVETNVCVDICPENMVIVNRSCFQSCPSELPFRQRSSVSYTSVRYNTSLSGAYSRRYNVTEDRFLCVSSCENAVLSNSSCEQNCPIVQKYISEKSCHNKTCLTKFERNSSYGIECLDHCPVNTSVYGNMCINSCPNGMVSHGSVCLPSCPVSEPYMYITSGESYQWEFSNANIWTSNSIFITNTICCSKCPIGYLFNMTCIDQCPSTNNIISNGECKSSCSEGYVLLHLDNDIHCLPRCPLGFVLGENRTCSKTCPVTAKFNYDGVCVSQCPKERPFGANLKEWSYETDKFHCISECEDDELFKPDEEICVYHLSCKEPYFWFDRQCLLRCPQGYLWFVSCFHKVGAIIGTVAVTILSFVYIFLFRCIARDSWWFMKEFRLDNHKVMNKLGMSMDSNNSIERSERISGYKDFDYSNLGSDGNHDYWFSEDIQTIPGDGPENSDGTSTDISLDMINFADSCVFQSLGSDC